MRRLQLFWERHPQAENALRAWFTHVNRARWQSFSDLRNDFASADQVKRLTVFNIGGNKYRLISRVEYHKQRVYIRSILTHSEYDKEQWKNDPWYE